MKLQTKTTVNGTPNGTPKDILVLKNKKPLNKEGF
jgi:hypothetical protein